MTVLLCPLCSQPRFNTLESLRVSLVNAATQSISCPICDDVLMGLDKLTIHLFAHTLNQNIETNQRPSLELITNTNVEDSCATSKLEIPEQYPNLPTVTGNTFNVAVGFEPEKLGEKFEERDKLVSGMEASYCREEPQKILKDGREVKNDNLCTVNMEDLNFLTSWESNVKTKQDETVFEENRCADSISTDKQGCSDLSDYMSDLLNRKLPILNFSFTTDSEQKCTDKFPETEEKQFKCGICGFIFQNGVILSMHEELVHSRVKVEKKLDMNLNQDLCNPERTEKPNGTLDNLASEKSNFFTQPVVNIQCNEVNLQIQDCETPSTVNDAGNKGEKNECQEGTLPRYDCHLCSKSFKMKGSLLLHFRVAHFGLTSSESVQILGDTSSPEERNLPCPICSKMFKKEQHLTQHIKTHEGKQWQCETCSKHFTTKYFLKKHQRLHTGEMPYSCLTCKKTFTFQQSYHKHLLYHSDEKPHQCSQCGRSFKELSTLHNHQRIHSGEKPFACETCGKCFRQRVSYIVHQRIHTGVLPYQCTSCKKKFRYKVSQRSHKCTAQPPGVVIRQPDIVQKILENNHMLQQNSL